MGAAAMPLAGGSCAGSRAQPSSRRTLARLRRQRALPWRSAARRLRVRMLATCAGGARRTLTWRRPNRSGAASAAAEDPGTAPQRPRAVLAALIGVAAVANLGLAVANVALPEIGREFDASQVSLNLVAVGYSLGLAASVLYFGAVGDRYGRKLLLILGMCLTIPADCLAAWAPSIGVLFGARVLGGLAAGMAYPTTLALITALWSGAARTRSIALWAAIGGAISSLGPLCSGILLQHFWWGSVFLLTLPLAVIALVMALRLVPAHVNETTEPVDHAGGTLSIVMVGALILGINFAPVPNEGTLVLGLLLVAAAATVAFYIRQRRAKNPLYDLDAAARPTFWVAAIAGIVVFGSLMGAMYIGQQFLQNVLEYSTVDSGLAILPAAFCMVLAAPRSAKLVESRGARFTLLFGYVFVLLGFLTMLLLWKENISYWKVGLGYAFVGIGVGPRGHARVALPDQLGAGQARRHGLGHRRSAARPRRRDHAVDLRRGADGRLRCRRRGCDRRLRQQGGHEPGRKRTDEVVLERRRPRQGLSLLGPARDHRRREGVLPEGRPVGIRGRHRRGAAGRRCSCS